MNARRRTRIALAVTVAVMAVGASVTGNMVFMRRARSEDRASIRRGVLQASSALDNELKNLEATVADWAVWMTPIPSS